MFDGYPDVASEKSIKSAERLRRTTKRNAPDVEFSETMPVNMSKEQFLSNENNKQRLISLLTKRLTDEHFKVKQATEDADSLIVASAVDVARHSECAVIVGEDTDLLVVLTALSNPDSSNIYLLKPGKGKQSDVVYSPQNYKFSTKSKDNILFLHAFSGCDSTSSFFGQGKLKLLKALEENKNLQDLAQIFKKPDATADEIDVAGQKCIAAIYSKNEAIPLSVLRYEMFANSLSKKSFNLASLPPTEAAARQHSFRTYLQVQAWLNNHLDPLKWGWKNAKYGLMPVRTTMEAAPEELLKTICCTCSKGCLGSCSCRKNGMKCTNICKLCKGHSCSNAHTDDLIIGTDHCDSEYDVLVEEGNADFDDKFTMEANNEIEVVLTGPSPCKRVKK